MLTNRRSFFGWALATLVVAKDVTAAPAKTEFGRVYDRSKTYRWSQYSDLATTYVPGRWEVVRGGPEKPRNACPHLRVFVTNGPYRPSPAGWEVAGLFEGLGAECLSCGQRFDYHTRREL